MHELMADKVVLRATWMAVASVKHSLAQINRKIPLFLNGSLRFVAPTGCSRDIEATWSAMGIKGKWLEVLVSLELCWRDGELQCSDHHRDDPDVIAKVSGCILTVLRIDLYESGKWLRLGRCAKAIVGG